MNNDGSRLKGLLYGLLLHYFISLFTINKRGTMNFFAPFGINASAGNVYKLSKKLIWKNIGLEDLDVIVPESDDIKVYTGENERRADENF